MKWINFIAVMCLFGTDGALAQATVKITEADCTTLVKHIAAADVAYRPGVDVHGNAVAPADLDARPAIEAPEVIEFDLTQDLVETLGLSANYVAEPVIGKVKVNRDGRVTFNEQPLTSEAQHELAKKCQRIVKQR